MSHLVLVLEECQVLPQQEEVDETPMQLRFTVLGNPEDRFNHIRCLLSCLVRSYELLNLFIGLVLLWGKVKESGHAHYQVRY